jgi:uncharacterized membrane protein YjgN (DUF898 family)
MSSIKLGRLAGLELSAKPSVFVGSLVLWVALSVFGLVLLNLSAAEAILGGLVAVLLHWLSAFIHQLGHIWAARSTSYPMTGVQFWFLLGTSRYPRDEPELPAAIHIRRALGGPPVSFVFAALSGLAALALGQVSGIGYWLALFLMLDNLLVFSLGALLPMSFTDGGTLWHWWRKR